MLTKQEIRMITKKARASVTAREEKDAQIEERFFAMYPNARRVFIYVSQGTEVSTRGILARLLASGTEVYVPYTDEAFCMHAVPYNGAQVTPDRLGNTTPPPVAVHDGQADITVVPLCAFNEDGYRIGQGKGCYDRYFASAFGGETVGLAYDEQAFAFTPERCDVPLDVILTPTRALKR